jgi:antitoxin component YwqK of YwqJK toxin-antitoxin module
MTQNGEEMFWFESRKVRKKGSYVNGKLNGKYEFIMKMDKKARKDFVDGKDGTWSEWYDLVT